MIVMMSSEWQEKIFDVMGIEAGCCGLLLSLLLSSWICARAIGVS